MKLVTRFSIVALSALAALGVAGSVSAQNAPEFRDSRTGKVWTPDMVSLDDPRAGSMGPQDRAFDPRAQNAVVEGIVVEHPRANLMGTVPITAGPQVPIATIDAPSLQVIPGRHWLSILYLTNNSGTTVDAVVGCHFTNHGQKVEETRVVIPPAGPGERLGVPVRGPRYDIFVDRVTCRLITPA